MKITITIDTDGAAFEDNYSRELRAVIKKAIENAKDRGVLGGGFRGGDGWPILDTNGNTCGAVTVEA